MTTETFEAKYDRLIEAMGGLGRVARLVPADMNSVRHALNNGDQHLNTIPLTKWDRAAGYISGLHDNGPVRLSFNGAWAESRNLSLAERVCILKRAAYRVAVGEVTA